eukprot:PhM_4_TR10956/c0_g1_i1/m.36411/K11407/HDAC6; histone deacetylase 6
MHHRTLMAYDRRCDEHAAPTPHCECPERTTNTFDHLVASGALDPNAVEVVTPTKCSMERIRYAHDAAHADRLLLGLEMVVSPSQQGDMFFAPGTREAVLRSAGAAVDVALAVARGDAPNGMTLTRPPGHHASASNISGFCFLNNAAIAARTVQREVPGFRRVVIFDWDVHHGDGTEAIFYDDPSVLTISLHQYAHSKGQHFMKRAAEDVKQETSFEEAAALLDSDDDSKDSTAVAKRRRVEVESGDDGGGKRQKQVPRDKDEDEAEAWFKDLGYIDDDDSDDSDEEEDGGFRANSVASSQSDDELFYPASGHPHRLGTGPGTGYNINIGWPAHHFGDLEYVHVTEKFLVPIIKEFAPDLIIIAAGFDAVAGDTLGAMKLTPSGYARMTELLLDCMPHRRVVATFEGGYNVPQVALCVEAVVRTLSGATTSGSRVLLHRAEEVMTSMGAQLCSTWHCLSKYKPKAHAVYRGLLSVCPRVSTPDTSDNESDD